ncbi:MOSC domain-containing protein [Nocardioides humilatus]|nr:MOSC domain-containing protein [Nocardioides humilatus]
MTPTVVSIHLAKASRLPMQAKDVVEVEAGKGIVGDRYHGTKHRHVTVQSRESLDEAADVFGSEVLSELTRRNLTISHGAVPREPGARLRIGAVLLEAVRVAAPCKLLDDTIGRGAQEALRRRAGTVFRVLEGGSISLGDAVEISPPASP